jgi:type II secretory pathway component PulF
VSKEAPEKRRAKAEKLNWMTCCFFASNGNACFCRIPLIQALDILADQVEKEKFKMILRKMHQDVQSGMSFSESMQKHDKVFSALFINMVKAGEQSGSLEEILDRVLTI